MRASLKRRGIIFVTLMLTLCLTDMKDFGIKCVEASVSMFPSDGDAWTENNNATYPWKFRVGYVDTMAWTTTDVQEGSYALNLTHTAASTVMLFRVTFDQNYNVSHHDGIYFWIKGTSPSSTFKFQMYIHKTDTDWDYTNSFNTGATFGALIIYNATWTRAFISLMQFTTTGTISWGSIRQIYFYFANLGSADETEILIDNLHFTTFDVARQTPTANQLKMMPLCWYNLKQGEHEETISGANYISTYDWMTLSTNATSSTSLESEVLGQTVFALCLAYTETNFEFYLDEAEDLVQFLLEAQEDLRSGEGGFHITYNDALGTWNRDMITTYDGWILAGLSYLYAITSNNTYKTACDSSRNYLTGIMWNSTHNIFNQGFNNNTQAIVTASSYDAMREGAACFGLASYYRFVSQNSTVLDRLDTVLNKVLTSSTYTNLMTYDSNEWEDNAYQLWGMWQAYQATSNTTYRDSFLNVTKIRIGTYMKHPSLNGSATRQDSYLYVWGTTGNYQDGWGLHNFLPLLYFVNQLEPQTYFINALELSLFNHLYSTQTNAGAFQRDDTVTYNDKQYYGTPSFIILASQLYHLQKSTDRYIVASDGAVISISQTTDTTTFNVDKTGISTTYFYCGSKGEPTSVAGATSWSYDSTTKTVTLTVTHSSANTVTLKWSAPPIPEFPLGGATEIALALSIVLVWLKKRRRNLRAPVP